MSEDAKFELRIEPKFKHLIRPLFKEEYEQLEKNIEADGCREPIITWNGVIIDGHNRYEICSKHNIPFKTKEVEFDSEEDAIAWICANQLGRRNISDETRKYLVGKKYEAEKIIGYRRNDKGWNQYMNGAESSELPYEVFDPEKMRQRPQSARYRTAERLGDEYHLSHCTVEKYGQYSKALDEIGRKEPALVSKILSGVVRISHENVVELSKREQDEVRRFNNQMDRKVNGEAYVTYRDSRGHFISNPGSQNLSIVSQPSVKDMPKYDPDADITGLTLTIPSWASSIERARSKSNLSIVSSNARARLTKALKDLENTVVELLNEIGEK